MVTELRHVQDDEQRIYLPDVSVTLKGRLPKGQQRGPVEVSPDFAVEVLSPDDRAFSTASSSSSTTECNSFGSSNRSCAPCSRTVPAWRSKNIARRM